MHMGSSSVCAGVRWWAAITLLVAGCSSKGLVTAKGFVRCDGEPVASGAISFHPAEGTSPPQGSRIVAGQFRVRIPRGRYRVQIVATRPQQGGVELTPGMPRQEQYIPSRYNAASSLEAHANGWWWNHFAFDLSTAEVD
jgi:hypothetical protein